MTAPEPPVPPAADGSGVIFTEPDARWQADFHGLLHIGELSSSFEWMGHKIVIRTLKVDEELMVASLTAEWAETIGGTKAAAAAICGIAVQNIDGQPMPVPLGESDSPMQWARDRFAYAQRWYPFTIDAIYARYLELEGRVREILDEMGKESGQEDATPGLSASSGSPVPAAS
jgi:hypothetical protein